MQVRMETSAGDILLTLYHGNAPETVANFTKLVGDGYYDGLHFHRVISDFMLQGGCWFKRIISDLSHQQVVGSSSSAYSTLSSHIWLIQEFPLSCHMNVIRALCKALCPFVARQYSEGSTAQEIVCVCTVLRANHITSESVLAVVGTGPEHQWNPLRDVTICHTERTLSACIIAL